MRKGLVQISTLLFLDPQSHLPFAVVGSTEEVKIGNKMVKARQYPWGTVQGKAGSHPAQEMRARSLLSNLLQLLPPPFCLVSNAVAHSCITVF